MSEGPKEISCDKKACKGVPRSQLPDGACTKQTCADLKKKLKPQNQPTNDTDKQDESRKQIGETRSERSVRSTKPGKGPRGYDDDDGKNPQGFNDDGKKLDKGSRGYDDDRKKLGKGSGGYDNIDGKTSGIGTQNGDKQFNVNSLGKEGKSPRSTRPGAVAPSGMPDRGEREARNVNYGDRMREEDDDGRSMIQIVRDFLGHRYAKKLLKAMLLFLLGLKISKECSYMLIPMKDYSPWREPEFKFVC